MHQPSPGSDVKIHVIVGSEAFVATLRPYLDPARGLWEVIRAQRVINRPSLAHLFEGSAGRRRAERDQQICKAHLAYGYSLTEIGKSMELYDSTISKIAKRHC